MASVYRKNAKWYVRFKDGAGRWRDTATKASLKTEAKELAKELERKAERQRRGLEPLPGKEQSMTFGELMDWWWQEFGRRLRSHTIRSFAEKHFRASLGPLPLTSVTAAKIESVLRKPEDLSAESLNHLRAFTHRLFALAQRHGLWTGSNPAGAVPRFKVAKRLPAYLRQEEVPRLLTALDARWRPIFATAIYTGLRRGELLALRKADVDLDAGTIAVCRSHGNATTKGGHADLLPIAEELRPYLRAALDSSPSEFVFPRADGRRQPEDLDLRRVLRRALGRAGIVTAYIHKCRRRNCGYRRREANPEAGRCPRCRMKLWAIPIPRPIRFHDCRHTTGTLLLKAGVPLATVQRILRHSDPAITSEVYGHLDLEDMRAGINRLSFQPNRNALPAADCTENPPPFAASLLLSSGGDESEEPGAPVEDGGTPGPFAVGATGFEPATTCTPSKCATRLRHAPMNDLCPAAARRVKAKIGVIAYSSLPDGSAAVPTSAPASGPGSPLLSALLST